MGKCQVSNEWSKQFSKKFRRPHFWANIWPPPKYMAGTQKLVGVNGLTPIRNELSIKFFFQKVPETLFTDEQTDRWMDERTDRQTSGWIQYTPSSSGGTHISIERWGGRNPEVYLEVPGWHHDNHEASWWNENFHSHFASIACITTRLNIHYPNPIAWPMLLWINIMP